MSVWKRLGAWTASGLILGLGLVVAAPAANAVTMPLTVYNDNGEPTDFTGELEITATGGGLLLEFTNTSLLSGNASESAIFQIWLEEGFDEWFDTAVINGFTGDVTFLQETVNPASTKPQDWSTIGWTTTWLEGYFKRDGNKDDGINAEGYDGADDSLTLYLAFDSGDFLTPEDLAELILAGELYLVAIHANACVDEPDASCNAYATPIPGTIWLLASALLGLVGFGVRRRRAVA